MGNTKTRRTADEISAIMRRVHDKDTTPEVVFREALEKAGVQFELSQDDLPGKPDVVLDRERLVVFIDGDYWHGNQWRLRGLTALEEQFLNSQSSSREYWLKKIRRNMRRDCIIPIRVVVSA